jgi:hypothetical protein
MKKNKQGEISDIAITVRLEPALSERLRVACFRHRLKKQPIFREALTRFFRSFEEAGPRKQQQILERLRAPAEEAASVPEKLLLDPALHEQLRRFVFDHSTYKQHVVRVALLDYLAVLERK